MVRGRVLLSAIFATLGVALAGCAAPSLPPGYYISGDPPGTSEYYCGDVSGGYGWGIAIVSAPIGGPARARSA